MTRAEKYVTDAWVAQAEFVRDASGRRVEKLLTAQRSDTIMTA